MPSSQTRCFILPLLIWLGCTCALAGGVELNAASFGLEGDGRTDNVPAMKAALERLPQSPAGTVLLIPKGRYVFASSEKYRRPSRFTAPGIDPLEAGMGYPAHLSIREMKDVVIAGEPGTEFVFKDQQAIGMAVDRCERLTIRGVAIDYDPLPFCQGTLVSSDATKKTLVFEADPAFPNPMSETFVKAAAAYVMVLAPDGSHLRPAGLYDTLRIVSRGGGRYEIQTEKKGVEQDFRFLRPGQTVVTQARGQCDAIKVFGSKDCVFEDLSIWSAPRMAINSQGGERNVYRRMRVEPKPGSGRAISTNADGLHSEADFAGPLVENCTVSMAGDDAVAIYNHAQGIFRQEAPNVFIVSRRYENYRVGDRVVILEPATGRCKGQGRVTDVGLVRVARTFGVKVALDAAIADVRTGDGSDGEGQGDAFVNLDSSGAGFAVRNNALQSIRARGVFLSARDGVVENNRFADGGSFGVVLQAKTSDAWLTTSIENIKIAGNTFERFYCGSPINAAFLASKSRPAIDGVFGIRNIVVEGNVFLECDPRSMPLMTFDSVEDVTVRNNRVALSKPVEAARFMKAVQVAIRSQYAAVAKTPVTLAGVRNVANVTIENNRVELYDPAAASILARSPQSRQTNVVVRTNTIVQLDASTPASSTKDQQGEAKP